MAVCIHIITSIHCSRISAITVKFRGLHMVMSEQTIPIVMLKLTRNSIQLFLWRFFSIEAYSRVYYYGLYNLWSIM